MKTEKEIQVYLELLEKARASPYHNDELNRSMPLHKKDWISALKWVLEND